MGLRPSEFNVINAPPAKDVIFPKGNQRFNNNALSKQLHGYTAS